MSNTREPLKYVGEVSRTVVSLTDAEVATLLQPRRGTKAPAWGVHPRKMPVGFETSYSYPLGSCSDINRRSHIECHLDDTQRTVKFRYRLGQTGPWSAQFGDSSTPYDGRIYRHCFKTALGSDASRDSSPSKGSQQQARVKEEAENNVILVFNGLQKQAANHWSGWCLFLSREKLCWASVPHHVALQTIEAKFEKLLATPRRSTA